MNEQTWWFLSRSTGMVAWGFLTLSVLWGILMSTTLFPAHRRPKWIVDLHSWFGGLTVGFLTIHLASLWADSYLEFTLADFLIPGHSTWEPLAAALGVFATWSIVVVQLTSLARKRLSRKVWHSIHLIGYASFVLGGIHGSMAGTDAMTPMYQWTNLIAVSAVVGATLHRVLRGKKGPATADTTPTRSATNRKLPDPLRVPVKSG